MTQMRAEIVSLKLDVRSKARRVRELIATNQDLDADIEQLNSQLD